jgi:DNA-binding protein Fis
MSRHNASKSYEIQSLVKQVNEATEQELYDLHGIEVSDGTVYDMCYDQHFDSVVEWATFNIEQEALEDDSSSAYGALDD